MEELRLKGGEMLVFLSALITNAVYGLWLVAHFYRQTTTIKLQHRPVGRGVCVCACAGGGGGGEGWPSKDFIHCPQVPYGL